MTKLEPNFITDLTGQTAIVTGASAGMGVRFARVLAACGANVVIAARRADKLEAVASEIRAEGGKVKAVPADLTDADQLMALVDAAEAEFGDVSILVNNAGVPDGKYATKISVELIDQVLDLNVRAPFILSREVAKRLIEKSKPGRIVNISSIAASSYSGAAPATLYAASKAAVTRMTEVLAVEWAKFNININAIAPGAFRSEMMDGMIARIGDASDRFPRKRLGDPSQLDSTLLYLVSPSSEFVTGTLIKVDDGQYSR